MPCLSSWASRPDCSELASPRAITATRAASLPRELFELFAARPVEVVVVDVAVAENEEPQREAAAIADGEQKQPSTRFEHCRHTE
jgi:hypothetical protein